MASNSGQERVNINALQQATSDDINVLQRLAAQHLAESLRQALLRRVRAGAYDPGTSATISPDVPFTPITDLAPAAAVVLGGLLPNPQPTEMLVDGGTIAVVAPAASPDANDSVIALVTAPALSPGVAFAANVSGNRWDLLECEVVDTGITTTGSVNIFNPGTRTFSGQTLQIRAGSTLSWRIRQGTPGAGVPAVASGWVPMAAILHPGATASFDDCEVFDLRPLAEDWDERVETSGINRGGGGASWVLTSTNFQGAVDLRGAPNQDPWDTTSDLFGQYGHRNGGRIRGAVISSIPGSSDDPLMTYAEFAAHSIGPIANATWYIVALGFPGNLPRWKRFTTAYFGGRRYPNGCGGILTLIPANSTPPWWEGRANALAPAATGIPVSMPSIMIGCVRSAPSGTVLIPGTCNWDGWQTMGYIEDGTMLPSGAAQSAVLVNASAVNTVGPGSTVTWQIARSGSVDDIFPPVPIAGFDVLVNLNVTGGPFTSPLGAEIFISDGNATWPQLLGNGALNVIGGSGALAHVPLRFSDLNSALTQWGSNNLITLKATTFTAGFAVNATASLHTLRIMRWRITWGSK